jgi:hypothetical protein
MSRHGKIARLPGPVREQVNLRLQNGENGQDIIAWLNSNDEVKAVLAQHFGGQEINDTNLSQWRKGGHRDWEMQQAAMDETHRIVAEGLELEKVGEKALADRLAVWLAGRYIVVTRKLLENEDDPAAWKLLRELCHDVVALRRGDHGAEWLRLDRERLELRRRREDREDKAAKAKSEAETGPAKEPMTEEEQDQAWRQIFGMQPL